LTGGTIDSYYDGGKDTVVPLKNTAIPDYLKGVKLDIKTRFSQVCMKDSRTLKEIDLKRIRQTIEKSPYTKFLIAHGTYTMPDTATYLKANLKRKEITVVLTGSMVPLTGFTNSDAPFNLGFSIAKLMSLSSGVYICMNGRVFDPEEVAKLISKGRFISVFDLK
jgi:L-asparaginase